MGLVCHHLYVPALVIEEELPTRSSWKDESPFETGYDLGLHPAPSDFLRLGMCDEKIAHHHIQPAKPQWLPPRRRVSNFESSKVKSPDVDAQRALNTQKILGEDEGYHTTLSMSVQEHNVELNADTSSGRVGVSHGGNLEFFLKKYGIELGRGQITRSMLNLDGPEMRIRSKNWVEEKIRAYQELYQEKSMLDYDGPEVKKSRGRNWSDEEIEALLEVRQEAARQGAGRQMWDYVSVNLYKQSGFDRASKSCMHQWHTLLKSFNTIRWHESKTKSGTSNCLSYWEMDKDERSKNKLPQAFHMEWYEMMERILSTMSVGEKTCASSGLSTGKSQLDEAVFGESEVEDAGTGSEDEEVSGDSTTTIGFQAGDPVCSHVPQLNQTCESDSETNSKEAGKKRSAATVMEDDLISMIAPFVKKQIDDALEPLLSALRGCGEDEDKHRVMLLAMVEGKREKLLL